MDSDTLYSVAVDNACAEFSADPVHLTADEIAALNAARTVLDAYGDRLTAPEHGRFSECASRAENAIFRVLNVAHSHGPQPMDYSALHNVPREPAA